MQILVGIDEADIELMSEELLEEVEANRQRIQGAMGEKYFEIVRGNFGEVGVDRPITWLPLSWSYAQRVKRSHATLFVTGKLESAIKFDNSNPDEAVISVSTSEIPYAAAHQFGYPAHGLPARPYFPFNPDTGETMPFTMQLVKEAGDAALREIYGGAL